MQHVPKIVRERLKAARSTEHHPDADVLTAFAERSLPEREHANVLAHLARCGDCRDVLALALPASDELQTVIVPVRGGWRTWSALRWGFAAAAGVAIVSLGILQYQRHLQPMTMARNEAVAKNIPTLPSAEAPAKPTEKKEDKLLEAASSLDAMSAAKTSPQSIQSKLIARGEQPQPSAGQPNVAGGVASGSIHGQLPHGPRMPTQWQQQNARVPAVQSPMPPPGAAKQQGADLVVNKLAPAPESLQVQSAQATVETQNGVVVRDQESLTQSQPSQSQPQFDYSVGVGKAKPPVSLEAANVAPQADAGGNAQELPRATGTPGSTERAFAQLSAPVAASPPRWTITPGGGLQRSFDQGRTWQDVDVNASLLSPAGLKKAQAFAGAEARAKDYQADKKALKAPAATVVFRAVTAIGTEVWAGGSNGALYHSVDAGAHWTQVVPSSGGGVPTGDIVGLEFSDAQHGKITTSTGEVWITSDNGQTWQKQ
jgi:photosynthesis system II assembly factor YCF48-like protein/putative zinc finger protein